jgi:hypothetical protein
MSHLTLPFGLADRIHKIFAWTEILAAYGELEGAGMGARPTCATSVEIYPQMSRSAARFIQADVARAIRAGKQAGAGAIELLPNGTIRICLNVQKTPEPPVEADREVVL